MFNGFLRVAERCAACGLPLKEHEKGDGPAFFGIVLVGGFVTIAACIVELRYEPPFWVHAALWAPLTALLSLLALRLGKTAMLHWQWHSRREDFE